MSNSLDDVIHKVYLDYVNNFLSVERFAEYYNISVDFAEALIKENKRKAEIECSLKKK